MSKSLERSLYANWICISWRWYAKTGPPAWCPSRSEMRQNLQGCRVRFNIRKSRIRS